MAKPGVMAEANSRSGGYDDDDDDDGDTVAVTSVLGLQVCRASDTARITSGCNLTKSKPCEDDDDKNEEEEEAVVESSIIIVALLLCAMKRAILSCPSQDDSATEQYCTGTTVFQSLTRCLTSSCMNRYHQVTMCLGISQNKALVECINMVE